jgi:hypothetical protein
VAVVSDERKWSPKTVSVGPLVITVFGGLLAVRTGASNVNSWKPVPTREATVMPTSFFTPYPVRDAHDTVVDELHVAVPHLTLDIVTVTVRSVDAKLSPDTVTDVPAVSAAFAVLKAVTTGESNENCPARVPARAATVSTFEVACPYPAGVSHVTCVSLFHTVTAQADVPIRADMDESAAPKFVP